jgi:thioredoxin reductase (NADPH)
MRPSVDCLIVGGGPAGLTAAIYLARFHLSIALVDAGDSRAAKIACTHNHAGFPGGISGERLLGLMRVQALQFGAALLNDEVQALEGAHDHFIGRLSHDEIAARTVLLATGVTNRRPRMPAELHDAALAAGRLRYCPVCDGFEVTDQRLAVIGPGAHAAKEAVFLRGYSRDVTLIAPDAEDGLSDSDRATLREAGVRNIDGPIGGFRLTPEGLEISAPSGRLVFEAVYPALGSDVHSALAVELGAEVTADGCIKVDAHQRSSVRGLYAAGDVVMGLDQISHAMGEAGVAATTIRNDVAARQPLLR